MIKEKPSVTSVKRSSATRAPARTARKEKPAGKITHYYGGIEVAIVKCLAPLKTGDAIHVKGAHTDFVQTIGSMQYNHKSVSAAKKGQQVGIKVDEKARDGDEVYKA